MHRINRLLIALFAVFALALTSCGAEATVTDDGQASDTSTDSEAGPTDSDTLDSDESETVEPEAEADAGNDDDETTSDSNDEADSADDMAAEAETDDDSDEDMADEAEVDTDFSGRGGGDFCAVAREFEENDPFEDDTIAPFSEEFFEQIQGLYANVLRIAPPEIEGDLVVISDFMEQWRVMAEKYDYNMFDPEFGAEMENLDSTALDEAGIRLEAYLADVCGIDTDSEVTIEEDPDSEAMPDLEDLENMEDFDLNQILVAQLGIEPELAECLISELGDLTEAMEDPSIMNQEICGTTLLQIMMGATG